MVADRTDRWRHLVALPDDDLPLDEGALLISAHLQPGLDVEAQLARLDGLAQQVDGASVDGVLELLFGRIGLTGNRVDYDDPANSYLDRVLDRGVGIPISLAVVTMEVARRRGVVLEGVGMPGHFLLRDPARAAGSGALVDAFDGGRRLDPEDCVAILQRAAGPGAQLPPGALEPVSRVAILIRMLANLERTFRSRGDTAGLLRTTRLQVGLPVPPPARQVALAGTLFELGAAGEAADVFEELAARADLAPAVAAEMGRRAVAARAKLN